MTTYRRQTVIHPYPAGYDSRTGQPLGGFALTPQNTQKALDQRSAGAAGAGVAPTTGAAPGATTSAPAPGTGARKNLIRDQLKEIDASLQRYSSIVESSKKLNEEEPEILADVQNDPDLQLLCKERITCPELALLEKNFLPDAIRDKILIGLSKHLQDSLSTLDNPTQKAIVARLQRLNTKLKRIVKLQQVVDIKSISVEDYADLLVKAIFSDIEVSTISETRSSASASASASADTSAKAKAKTEADDAEEEEEAPVRRRGSRRPKVSPKLIRGAILKKIQATEEEITKIAEERHTILDFDYFKNFFCEILELFPPGVIKESDSYATALTEKYTSWFANKHPANVVEKW